MASVRLGSALVLAVIAVLIILPQSVLLQASAGNGQDIYPCSSCHAGLPVSGVSKWSEFHGINLTTGAHRGLYCVNCHVPDTAMMKLRGGVDIKVLGLHSHEELMETNRACATCHPRTYMDYLHYAHGNTTFKCASGGEEYRIVGYKNVTYIYHACNDYHNLTLAHPKACVECHNPHDPVVYPLNILPKQSDRPEPPDQTPIAIGGILSGALGLTMIGLSAFYASKRGSRP